MFQMSDLFWMVLFALPTPLYCVDIPARRLHYDLFEKGGYDNRVRPSGRQTTRKEILLVKLGLRLSQILEMQEKDQIMTTSVWLKHEWYDERLVWDPIEYNGVTHLHLPTSKLWIPDIVLYNNADGDFTITKVTKASIHHTGLIRWVPPAIFKSYCFIDVEYFPFDVQTCSMRFGTWSHNANEVDLQPFCAETAIQLPKDESVILRGIDINEMYQNAEWDLLNVTVRTRRQKFQCCPEPYQDLRFNVTIRRKTLFYTVNLIFPCIAISCLSVVVFYLPTDCYEKITLSLSILMALSVFFLLLLDIIPPTSLVIPLIGRYLLFTMMTVSMSIILTVFVISVHLRSPSTHTMSPWVRRWFTEIIPRILLMTRPQLKRTQTLIVSQQETKMKYVPNGVQQHGSESDDTEIDEEEYMYDHEDHDRGIGGTYAYLRNPVAQRVHPEQYINTVKGASIIAASYKEEDIEEMETRDWKFIAMVVDRIFLILFTLTTLGGTVGIVGSPPSLYIDQDPMVFEPNANCTY